MGKIKIRNLLAGIVISIILSGCHSMPVIPSAEILAEKEQMLSGRMRGYMFYFNGAFFVDFSNLDLSIESRWNLNHDWDWGLMVGLTKLYMPYLSVDFRRNIFKTEDFFMSFCLNLAGSVPYISCNGLIMATKKFGYFGLTPVLGMELLTIFPYRPISYMNVDNSGQNYQGHIGFVIYADFGLILNFQFENIDNNVKKKHGFGIGCLYKKCITAQYIDYIYPEVFVYKIF